MTIRKTLFILSAITFVYLASKAQEPQTRYAELTKEEILEMPIDSLVNLPFETLLELAEKLGISIDELLNMKVTTASKTELSSRESPGIISTLTAEDIKKTGAGNLAEVLNFIPGIYFGYDIDGITGPGMRGNWGHEGKILVLIDGQEFNELFCSTPQHMPLLNVDQIKRIEIIRGPGSSIYGGNAELGVINIETWVNDDEARFKTAISAFTNGNQLSNGNFYVLGATRKYNSSLAISAHGMQGYKSDRELFAYDSLYNLNSDLSKYSICGINLKATVEKATLRFLIDHYETGVHGYDDPLISQKFDNIFAEFKYDVVLNNTITLIPKINYKSQTPWYLDDPYWYYHKTGSRLSGELAMEYVPNEKINILSGISGYVDHAKDRDEGSYFINNRSSISYQDYTAYIQGLFKTRPFNIVTGARLEKHSEFGLAFSPRIGLTKVFDNLHAKFLLSSGYRAPSIENLNLNKNIKPEKTLVIEFETGYKISSNLFCKVNLFDITIYDPIVYVFNWNDETESYENMENSGSRGIEAEINFIHKKGYANLSYSYYTASHKNNVDYYMAFSADGDPIEDNMLGSAKHKFTCLTGLNITNNFSINGGIIYLGERYGFEEYDTEEELVFKAYDPEVMVNLTANWDRFLINNLSFVVGVNNLLNADQLLIQPYQGGEVPYPGQSRQFMIKINYSL